MRHLCAAAGVGQSRPFAMKRQVSGLHVLSWSALITLPHFSRPVDLSYARRPQQGARPMKVHTSSADVKLRPAAAAARTAGSPPWVMWWQYMVFLSPKAPVMAPKKPVFL